MIDFQKRKYRIKRVSKSWLSKKIAAYFKSTHNFKLII